jgi:hypothetical protein
MGTMTAAEYRKLSRKSKAAKYKQARATLRGESFPSKLEAAVFEILRLRVAAGQLDMLTRYDKVSFLDGFVSWSIDFWAIETKTSSPVWIEAKGYKCQKWRLFEKVWKDRGPGKLVLYMGDYRNPTEMPPIIPSGKARST